MKLHSVAESDVNNLTLEVLSGSVLVELPEINYSRTLQVNDNLKVGLIKNSNKMSYCYVAVSVIVKKLFR